MIAVGYGLTIGSLLAAVFLVALIGIRQPMDHRAYNLTNMAEDIDWKVFGSRWVTTKRWFTREGRTTFSNGFNACSGS
jgi:hypothetical protein